MATIEVQGYVNKPEAKQSKAGKGYSVFTLASKQKNGKDASGNEKPATRVYYNCTDFKNSSPPPDGSFAKVQGYFSVRDYVTKGDNPVAGKAFEINVQEVTVSDPLPGASPKAAAKGNAKPEPDPWD